MTEESRDFSQVYELWRRAKPGPRAELRRVSEPDELMDLPAFYRLVEPVGWKADMPDWEKEGWKRLVYLINHVENRGDHTLGKALAISGKVNEQRLFQIVRSDYPNDVIQLRRLLKQVEPAVNWRKAANQLWRWSKSDKRALMEDFILNQEHSKDQ